MKDIKSKTNSTNVKLDSTSMLEHIFEAKERPDPFDDVSIDNR